MGASHSNHKEKKKSKSQQRSSDSDTESSSRSQCSTPRTSTVVGDRYRIGELIGRGSTGTVHLAFDHIQGRTVAIKEIAIANKQQLAEYMHEVRMLESINHKNIISYSGTVSNGDLHYIVMEHAPGGSVADLIRRYGPLTEEVAKKYIINVLSALQYLHSKQYVHGDIKGANILLVNNRAKLSDFGCSGSTALMKRSMKGTANWMAPEVVLNGEVTPASDIWSIGATIVEMVTGQPPYHGKNSMDVLKSIAFQEQSLVPNSGKLSSDLAHFLQQCFTRNARSRPTASDLLRHSWLKGDVISFDDAIGPLNISVPSDKVRVSIRKAAKALDSESVSCSSTTAPSSPSNASSRSGASTPRLFIGTSPTNSVSS